MFVKKFREPNTKILKEEYIKMTTKTVEPSSRTALRSARRVLIKAGTSIVANKDGRPSLTRLGAIVEQISELMRSDIEVIFVSSGAVGMGKKMLRTQNRLNMSFLELQNEQEEQKVVSDDHHMHRSVSFASFVNKEEAPNTKNGAKKKIYDSACAAAGQVRMLVLKLYNFDMH